MGYFASIANQSGLHFPGGRTSSRAARATSVALPEPLDFEETVIVQPSVQATAARPEARTQQHALPDDDGQGNTRQEEAPATSVPFAQAKLPEPPGGERSTISPVAGELHGAITMPPGSPVAAGPHSTLTTLPGRAAVANGEPPDQPMIEHTVFAAPPDHLRVPERESAPAQTAPAAKVPSEIPSAPRYLARTAEMIAGRRVDPVEMQTVVLREVQEWIAAGLEPGHKTTDQFVEPSRERVDAEETVPPIGPEPGAARMVTRRPAVETGAVPPPPGIEEQRFELSIGTISVVVEGDDKPGPPARNATQPPVAMGTPQKTRRQGSRLSRSYL